MKVILQQHLPSLGKMGQIVEVGESYARNFLFPKKIAVPATSEAIKKQQRADAAKTHDHQQLLAHEATLLQKLTGITLELTLPASASGTLFAALQERDVRHALVQQHQLTLPLTVRLQGLPIKHTGEHQLQVSTSLQQSAEFVLRIHRQ